MSHQRTIVISINASWNIINFRLGLISALQTAGYRVVALAPRDEYSLRFAELGIEFVSINIDNKGVSPGRDLVLLAEYYRRLRKIRPDIFLGYTAKPNIYGSLAAHALGIPVINNISGLGTAFIREGLLTKIVSTLYRMSLRRSVRIFFQNEEDQNLFIDRGIVRAASTGLLPGSGIDLAKFQPMPTRAISDELIFLLVARLLRDKGVGEFVEAARIVSEKVPQTRFQLLGFLDVENRTALSKEEVSEWEREGVIEYLGGADDVRPFMTSADVIVLPSYREGLPRVLLEGGALGKPLITTDVPGCRQVVTDGSNGFLCNVRDPQSLADAMLRMNSLTREARAEMGAAARRNVERFYDERIPIERYLEAIEQALGRQG